MCGEISLYGSCNLWYLFFKKKAFNPTVHKKRGLYIMLREYIKNTDGKNRFLQKEIKT